MSYYILNEDHTTKQVSFQEYFDWEKKYGKFGDSKKRVGRDKIEGQDCEVSTVFLGINHSFSADEEPILFETLVFDGKFDGEMERYSTWGEAVKGHADMVKKCGGVVRQQRVETNDSIDNRFDILDL